MRISNIIFPLCLGLTLVAFFGIYLYSIVKKMKIENNLIFGIILLIAILATFVFLQNGSFKETTASYAGWKINVINEKYKEIVEIDQKLSKISTEITTALTLYIKERGLWGSAYLNLDEWDKTLKKLADLSIENVEKRKRIKQEVDEFIKQRKKQIEEKKQRSNT